MKNCTITNRNTTMDTKTLRQKILDLAIHGKLVPQDPNDEPASVLLERIKAEKERLIKEGKIKRSKKSAKTSDTPHYPYLLPKGWKWCKLEDIVSFGGGKTPSMGNKEYWDNGKHLWVTSKDMKCSHITNSLMKITDKALVGMTLYEKGTLLVVTRSGILRHTLPLSILEKPATVNQDLKTISPHIQELSEYLYVIIKANEHIILKEYHKDGTTVDSIDFDKFRCLPIPLAPIAEQKRIIAETKNWLSLIDQIEQGKADLQTTIKQTKSKTLDLAIHGKLVPQDPIDVPAVELLKRINPNFTPCDNGQYGKIPRGWFLAKLGDLFDAVSAKRVLKSEWRTKGVPFYRAREIVKLSEYNKVNNELFIEDKHYDELKKRYGVPASGDIMLSAVGTIGKSYIVKESDKFYYKDASVLCLRNHNKLSSMFFSMLFSSSFIEDQIKEYSKGTTVDTITLEKLKSYIVPLPPLNEQQRIVQKIEELFLVLDNIQKALEV